MVSSTSAGRVVEAEKARQPLRPARGAALLADRINCCRSIVGAGVGDGDGGFVLAASFLRLWWTSVAFRRYCLGGLIRNCWLDGKGRAPLVSEVRALIGQQTTISHSSHPS
jgi:hypothetical protein